MARKIKKAEVNETLDIHLYYMNIINALPGIVYWIDENCQLKGCNNHFIQVLGIKRTRDMVGTPYQLMTKFTKWSEKRIDAFKFDDMKAIFTGEPQYDVQESAVYHADGKPIIYRANRIPLFGKNKQVSELVVTLTDITNIKTVNELKVMHSSEEKKIDMDYIPKVLMVEDNVVAQKIEKDLLTTLRCEVDVADSGDQALSLFKPSKYDIVLMDIGLQDTSGYMVAKKMRQMEEKTTAEVPIIALTSYQADVVKHDCIEYLMDGVLTKPLTYEQAKQLIQLYVFHEEVEVDGLKNKT